MDLILYKSVHDLDRPLCRLDGRVKTVFFLIAVIVSAVVKYWYLAAALWLAAIALYATLRLPWRLLVRRLLLPFGVAWLVFASLLFTTGTHQAFVIDRPFRLAVYVEGIDLGIVMMLRIMAAVTMAAVLSLCTPMVEILETLRILKLPGIMVDIADMMYRYVFILDEMAHNMHHAQVSRTTRRLGWYARIRNAGMIAVHVMLASLYRSARIYEAMLSRGYDEDGRGPAYFTRPVPAAHLWIGAGMTFATLAMLAASCAI